MDKKVWNKDKKIQTNTGRTHFKKGSTPWNKGLVGFLSENKHYKWKGNKVGYRSLHEWVIKHKGHPAYCIKCGKDKTTQRSIQWANIDHKYNRVLDEFISLCAKCHLQYDIENGLRKKPNYGRK